MKKTVVITTMVAALAASQAMASINTDSNAASFAQGGTAKVVFKPEIESSLSNRSTQSTRVTQSARQGQDQSQGQGQLQGQINGNNDIEIKGDVYQPKRQPVATAYAPTLVPTAPCTIAGGLGLSGVSGGVSIGGSVVDHDCKIQEQAKTLASFNEMSWGLALMCQELDEVYLANPGRCFRLGIDRTPDAVVVNIRDYSQRPCEFPGERNCNP